MVELSDGGSHWRWMAKLQDSLVIRIGVNGRVYGTNPSELVPLRVQMIRSALHWPIKRNAGASAIRAADVERDGKAISCLLLSGSIPPNPAPRSWVENEYCIDPDTGLLQTWSEAPGIFAVYDYGGAAEFHGHMLPRQISIFEEGHIVVQARVESLEDSPNIDASLFQPTPEMVEEGDHSRWHRPTGFRCASILPMRQLPLFFSP
jgi:hypothetical protein